MIMLWWIVGILAYLSIGRLVGYRMLALWCGWIMGESTEYVEDLIIDPTLGRGFVWVCAIIWPLNFAYIPMVGLFHVIRNGIK